LGESPAGMPRPRSPGRKVLAMSAEIAERNFVVEASRDRVWRLIGKVIFSCLPGMENIEILDENNFRAVLRIKITLINLGLKVEGEMVDISPPESLAVRLALTGPGGLRMDQRVSVALASLEKGKTGLACKATVERMEFLFQSLLLRQARRFASATFAAIEKRLQEVV